MPETGTSGLMSGEGKRSEGPTALSNRASLRLYSLIRATLSPQREACSPHERSEMRGRMRGEPGYRFAHPGYAVPATQSM
jgi:hypothetical protein